MKQAYGWQLTAALRLKNMKQSELADELGITQAAVSKIINGSQYLDFDMAVKACNALDISLAWLATGVESDSKKYFKNPERQRIEYLLSIINEAEFPMLIAAMEEIIEVRINKEQGTGSKEKKKKK
jgi:transcriptional regulator with XRE-family HTH domain